jgi:hypothetical protein
MDENLKMPSITAVNGNNDIKGFFLAGQNSEQKGVINFYSDLNNEWSCLLD